LGWGDEILVTGHVRQLQERDPRKVRVLYERPRWNEVWDHNPRIATPKEQGDFQEFRPRVNGLRPYCTAKTPERWTWKDYKPPVGEFYFDRTEKNFASAHCSDVILEPHLKGKASPNKDWGWDNWVELALRLSKEGLRVCQVGDRGTQLLYGAKLIETPTFRYAAAALSSAKAAVLPEGGLHHAAAAVGLRSVVIFGGFISPRQTGYDTQTNLFTGGEPCGWRTPCNHCRKAMDDITPQWVMEEVKRLLA
jgi:hypothetical protein